MDWECLNTFQILLRMFFQEKKLLTIKLSMEEQGLNLNQLVALFLSEEIRSHRTSLSRAAEISERVIPKLKSINSESQALSILKDIEKDFEEVSVLKQALHFGTKASDIKVYEAEIKEYASRTFVKDLHGCN